MIPGWGRAALRRLPAERLLVVACAFGIGSLVLLCWGALVTRALPIILGMAGGQGLGAIAFACYLLAVLSEAARQAPRDSIRPEGERASRGE